MKRTLLLCAVLTGFAAAPVLAGGPNVQEGMWEITSTTEMPGMPMAIPPVRHSQCLTQQDLVPRGSADRQGECQVSDIRTSGNTVSWKIACSSPGGSTSGSGSITYAGTSMNGTMTMTVPGGMQMTTRLTGRRTGECK